MADHWVDIPTGAKLGKLRGNVLRSNMEMYLRREVPLVELSDLLDKQSPSEDSRQMTSGRSGILKCGRCNPIKGGYNGVL